MRTRALLISVLALGSFGLGILHAQAMSLNPPIFEFSMSPGDRVEDVIKVFNDSRTAITLKPEKVNFTAKADDEVSGTPDFYPLDETRTGRELAPWIDVVDSETGLDPLTRQDIPFSITVPEDASPGSYFGGIILRSGQGADRGVGLVTGTAVLMLVKVKGDVVEDATLTDFGVLDASQSHLPVRFQARVVNSGTVYLQPTGTVAIRNMFGKTVASVPVNPELRSVLPDSARRYEAVWGDDVDEGASEFMKQWSGFRFGSYTANLELTYGDSGKTLTASTRFLVIPWMVLGALLLGLLVIVFGIRGFFRWYAKRIIAKHHARSK